MRAMDLTEEYTRENSFQLKGKSVKKIDVIIIMAENFPKLVTDTKPQIQNLRYHQVG